jgi:hypothetical protein
MQSHAALSVSPIPHASGLPGELKIPTPRCCGHERDHPRNARIEKQRANRKRPCCAANLMTWGDEQRLGPKAGEGLQEQEPGRRYLPPKHNGRGSAKPAFTQPPMTIAASQQPGTAPKAQSMRPPNGPCRHSYATASASDADVPCHAARLGS